MKTQAGILAAALFGGAMAGDYAIAEFGESGSGLMGYIKVANGWVMVDLNFSQVDYSELGLATDCAVNGLGWHMHKWWNVEGEDGYGGTCGASATDWHFDPWLACGGATGNRDCETRWDGCVTSTYDCSTSSYANNPLNCEVGDWSGQFGNIPYTNGSFSAQYFSYWSPTIGDLIPDMMNYSTSVVIHCQGGARAFCAGFKYGSDDMEYTQPTATSTNVFDFKQLFEGFMVQTDDAGYTAYIPEALYSDDAACQTWSLNFHTEWNSESHSLMSGCDAATGSIADPTNQCVMGGSSMYCEYDSSDMMWSRCNGSEPFTYDCSGFDCAIGDASGRIGTVDLSLCTGENLITDEDNNIICMLRLWDDIAVPQAIIGSTVNSVSLTCAADTSVVACAKLGADTNDYDDDDGDADDSGVSGVAALFATLFAAAIAAMH